MRGVIVIVLLAGCRQLLGFEDPIVGEPPMIDDAALEASSSEMSPEGLDAPTTGCPASYQTLPNSGPRGHRYKLISTSRPWTQQRDACANEGTFLAFPDGTTLANAQAESNAINAFAGACWLGVNDIAVEGQFRNSLNAPVSAITAMLINQGGNPNGTDCLFGTASALNDDDCAVSRVAVCECVP